jgi:hypothetical protein
VKAPSHTTTSSSSASGPSTAAVPPRLLRAIDTVRARLPTATDFAELYERFDDHIARAPELWESSHLREDDVLFSIAVTVAARIRPGFQALMCSLYEVGDTGFWHGAVTGTNALACLFYDERAGIGLVALSNPFDGTGRTDFVRLTRVMLAPPSSGSAGSTSVRLLC